MGTEDEGWSQTPGLLPGLAPRTRSQGPAQNKVAPAGPHSSTETETGTQGSQPKLEDPVGQLWAPRRGPLTSVQSRATHRDSVVTATVLLEPAGSHDRALTAEGFALDNSLGSDLGQGQTSV